jgi:hypothetical protein
MSTLTAGVVLAVVVVVVGAGAYVVGSAVRPGAHVVSSCAPPSSPACAAVSDLHDLRLLVPFATAQQASTIPFTALLPPGASSNSFTFNFGDGSKPVTSSVGTIDHAFAFPGTYIVQVSASIGGAIHDNDRALAIVNVASSGAMDLNGQLPGVSGVLVSNSTSSASPTAILQPSESATFSGTYTSAPTNPSWTAQTPALIASAPATAAKPPTSSAGSVSGTFLFPSAGTYTVSFVGAALGPGGARAYQNFTWTVFVPPTGVHASAASGPARTSPHPGTIVAYEDAPGGAFSLDPGIDYDAVGFEPIMNIYQTLIFYNQNVTGPGWQSYAPQLATCVPGSPQCAALYGGNSLVQGYNYTFVINRASRFYDPATGASWPVYPSDVMFSFARYASFADQPCAACTPDWIQQQALLPAGNYGWDGGIHAPYNNTPQAVFSSMAVNDSRWCPHVAITNDHGCVTFHVDGGGLAWPYFLELVADPFGASVMPCGWVSSNAPKSGGAGLPYWTANNVSGPGDRPCLLPGGATSTAQPSFLSAVAAIPPTGWDSFQARCSGTLVPGVFCGTLQTSGVGSGPYYLKSYASGSSYVLGMNPAYAQNPYCTSLQCEPPAGKYAKTVEVTWESDPTVGEEAYRAGVADFATIPSTDTALLLQLSEAGDVNALTEPTLGLTFFPFILNFNPTLAKTYTSNPVTPFGDWFSYIGMRQFFVHAYPYSTAEATVNTKDGIVYSFNSGGMIPQFMANYYPTNISWPSGDPCTDPNNPNCAAYWWAQMHSSSSPYYDPEVLKCTAASPCTFPFLGWAGSPDIDQRMAMLESSVKSLSGGAVVFTTSDVTQGSMVTATGGPPGQSATPLYEWGWYPDYPDPTDYVVGMYFPDRTYTYGDAVAEQLALYNGTSCSTSASYYVNLATPVSQACQGAAYWQMLRLIYRADVTPIGPERVLLYNMAEHIANQLALYINEQQLNAVVSFSSWIRANSIDTNVLLVGSFTWYSIAGNSVWYPGST